jgi:hypothetical protein
VLVTGWVNPSLDSGGHEDYFESSEGWWKKRLSQKSLVDEKRSGRPSILRKVQKLVIYKSVHKRGWNTRKLASKQII